MRKFRKLAALCAVLMITLSMGLTAYAAPEDETVTTPTETAAPPAESQTPAPSNDGVTVLLPPGTGTVVDVFEGEDGRKFYTIQTPAGNTFYLIIDFTMTGDNVYFLDAVQEKDLLALAEKADNGQTGGNAMDADPNTAPTSEPTPGNQTEPEQKDNNNIFMFAAICVVVIGGAVFYFVKGRKGKQKNDSRDEYEDEPDEYIPDDYDTEPENDSPPWEDEENV